MQSKTDTVKFISLILLIVVLLSVGSFFGFPKSPRGAADGRDLSQDITNPLASTLTIQSSLYLNGRPDNGARGSVKDIAVWENFLYASYVTSNADFYLDAWDISNSSAPAFLGALPFGNAFDDQNRLLPVAALQGPRDLHAIDGNLLVWTSFGLKIYPIQNDGRLGAPSETALRDDLNDTLNRVSFAGDFASVSRRMLSDQQFNQLIGRIPQGELEKLLQSHVLINLQDPLNPYFLNAHQDYGLAYQKIDTAVSGIYRGLPAALSISDDKRLLNVTTSSIERLPHYDGFWQSPLNSIFSLEKRANTLFEIIDETVPSSFVRRTLRISMSKLLRQLHIRGSSRIPTLIGVKYGGETPLREVMSQLSIRPTDSLRLALQKAIEAQISSAIDRELSLEIGRALSRNLSDLILVNRLQSLSNLRDGLSAAFDAELDAEQVAKYITLKIISPLLGNPAFMKLTVAGLIKIVASNPLAQVIDAGLTTFHTFLPVNATLKALRFDPPGCFDIPDSASGLLNLMFIENGPRLRLNGLAFYEMLKLAQYYFGDTNFAAFETELGQTIRSFHSSLSTKVAAELSPFADTLGLNDFSLESLWGDFMGALSVKPILSRVIAEAILNRIERLGVSADLSVAEALAALNLYVDQFNLPPNASLSSVSDLLQILRNRLRLGRVGLNSLVYRSTRLGRDIFGENLKAPVRKLLNQLFGDLPSDTMLEDAISRFATGKVPADVMGDLTHQLLNQILEVIDGGGGFPAVLGVDALFRQGDCLAQWELALEAAAEAADASFFLSAAAVPIRTAEAGIVSAARAAADYVIESLLKKMVEEIFSNRGKGYSSFQLGLETASRAIDLFNLAGRSARQVNVAAYSDRVAAVMRDMGASFPSETGNNLVTLLTFDPLIPDSKSIISLGSWDTLNTTLSSNQYLLLVGQGLSHDRIVPRVVITDLLNAEDNSYALIGDAAINLSASQKFISAKNGEQFVVLSQRGIEIIGREVR